MIKWILCGITIFIAFLYFKAFWFQRFRKVKIQPSRLSVYYGAPGVGKSTFAAALADAYIRCGIPVYSNVPITGTFKVEKSDLGSYLIENGLLIWDEVGVDFNSRSFKSNFTPAQIKWFKYHRHENMQVVIFSQGFDDMDKILRTLSTDMYLLRRSFLPYLITAKLIYKKPSIDPDTHQPVDMYDFARFKSTRIFAPLSWKLFNSFERLGLPPHDFPRWGSDSDSAGREPAVAEHSHEVRTFDDWTEFQNLPTTDDYLEEVKSLDISTENNLPF